MKVIDLLNKIANGEEIPKKIKYNNQIYELTENKIDWYCYDYARNFLGNEMTLQELNNKVEIIEEDKKIDKLDKLDLHIPFDNFNATYNGIFMNKINEIIEVINEKI